MIFEQIQMEGELGRLIPEVVYYRDFEPPHPIDRFFPDANAYLILEFNDLPQHTYNDQNEILETFRRHWFSGNRTEAIRFDSGKGVEMMVVTIKNAFAYPILQQSLVQLTNRVVQAEELFGNSIEILWKEIRELSTLEERIAHLRSFFEDQVRWNDKSREWLHFFETLEQRYSEQLTVQQLVEEVGLSQKSLIQQFKKHIGITPKEFVRLKRFQKFIGLLGEGIQTNSLTQLAFDCGYFDQSHCIREFRQYTGTTPRVYLQKRFGYDNYMPDQG